MRRALTSILLAASTTASVLTVAAVSAPPASAQVPTLRQIRTLDHTLSSYGPSTGTDEAFSTPAIADVNHDGTPEFIVAGNDGSVIAWRSNGTVLWSVNVGGAVDSSPAVADINGDLNKDVVVGTMAGQVVYLNGPTGGVVKRFDDVPTPGKPIGFFATPSIADLDGDGRPEIIATSWDHNAYAWHRDGTPYFRTFVRDTIWSSPTVVDINGDGRKEIIFGGDKDDSPQGGYLWMLRYNGSVASGYPKVLAGQTIWSSPSVGDIDGDRQLDIVVGTGLNFPNPNGRKMYAFSASGALKPGWPVNTPGRVVASPALGDVNGDGRLDVVIGTEGGYVAAYGGRGSQIWNRCNRYSTTTCTPETGLHGQAVIADVDDDGKNDVISTMEGTLRVRRGSDGAALYEGFIGTAFGPAGGASVEEVGGKTYIAQSVVIDSNRDKRRDAGDTLRTLVWTTDTAMGRAPWPTFRGDAARSGVNPAGTEPWYPFSSATALVNQQYLDLLGRQPEPAGAKYWADRLVNRSVTGAGVIVSFINSKEFGTTLAPVVRNHLALTGKMPTSYAALNDELTAARNGTTPAQLADRLIAADSTASSESNEAFVNRVYRFSWGTAPTSSQLQAALTDLQNGVTRGTELVKISGQQWAVLTLQPKVQVIMVYVGMLRRLPDGDGFNYWVTKVKQGTTLQTLAKQFQYSTEYANRFR